MNQSKSKDKIIKQQQEEREIKFQPNTAFGKNILRPPYRFMDLIDVSNFGKRTYSDKPNFIVYSRADGQGIELMNTDIAVKPLSANETKSPSGIVVYNTANANQFNFSTNIGTTLAVNGAFTNTNNILTINKTGVYSIGYGFNMTLTSNIHAYRFFINSVGLGSLCQYKREASANSVSMNVNLTDSFGGSVSGTVTKTFDDLSDILDFDSGYMEEKVLLTAGDTIELQISVESVGGAGSFTLNTPTTYYFAQYIRPGF